MAARPSQDLYGNPDETIRLLQEEVAETNQEVLVLTLELEQRVEERTAELFISQQTLHRTNCELVQLTALLEDRVAQRTSELERANGALQQLLQEKEVLIKEIHHRVKNNLQVISCLLNMHAVTVKEEGAVAALLESERRVMAMAAIHEQLYGHKRLDRINICEYAKSLVQDLIGSYASSGSQIEGRYSIAPVELHIEQAVPCGLILNELITNCLKYAYPAGGQGAIFVGLQQLPDQKLRLSVADHGPGLPDNFEWKKSKSLGVTIVNLLTKQLGGTQQIESSCTGTAVTVVFPKLS